MTAVSDRYRKLADAFSARVEAVPAGDARWQQQSPCPDWKAIDVVSHLVDAHTMFFGFIGHEAPAPPPVADDPAAAWAATRRAMEATLDDPAVARREYEGMFGTAVWEESIDRFISGDVLAHTWDLSRALGVDDTLDAEEARAGLAALEPLGDNIRRPGVFGPAVEPPPDATDQERFIAYIGRDPRWTG